jgi:hypothetical protein
VQESPAKVGTLLAVGFYYVSTALHAMCAIELLHAIRIRVLILDNTLAALVDKWQMTLATSRVNTGISSS